MARLSSWLRSGTTPPPPQDGKRVERSAAWMTDPWGPDCTGWLLFHSAVSDSSPSLFSSLSSPLLSGVHDHYWANSGRAPARWGRDGARCSRGPWLIDLSHGALSPRSLIDLTQGTRASHATPNQLWKTGPLWEKRTRPAVIKRGSTFKGWSGLSVYFVCI